MSLKPENIWLGKAIKSSRKKLRITQSDLADALSLSRTSLANIEAGRQSVSWSHLLEFYAIFKWKHIPIPPMETKKKTIEVLVPDFNSIGDF